MPAADPRRAALEDLACAGGRNAEVEIVEYDPTWPAAYVAERERLAQLLPAGVQLHHFGSTAQRRVSEFLWASLSRAAREYPPR
ncbi:MAG TPA: GrpB family protein [Solirubrobacteraceae bacterium]